MEEWKEVDQTAFDGLLSLVRRSSVAAPVATAVAIAAPALLPLLPLQPLEW